MKIQQAQSNMTFQKKVIIDGQGLQNLYNTFGTNTTDKLIKKVSSAAHNIQGNDVLWLSESTISGNKIKLKGKYFNDHSVEKISIDLNKKATQHKTKRHLERFLNRLNPVDIFES